MPTENQDVSLRDSLVSAFEEEEKKAATEGQDREAIVADDKRVDKDPAGDEPKSGDPASDDKTKVSDDKQEAADDKTKLAADGNDVEQKAAKEAVKLDPPARWTKQQKERFAKLDPESQRMLVDHDKSVQSDYTKKTQEISTERQRIASIDEVLSPFNPHFVNLGLDMKTGLKQVMDSYAFAFHQPERFISWFLQQRNIDPRKLFGLDARQEQRENRQTGIRHQVIGYNGQGQPVIGEMPPQPSIVELPAEFRAQFEAMQAQNAVLQTGMSQIEQNMRAQAETAQRAIFAEAATELDRFGRAADAAGNELHPFYEEVKYEMGVLMRTNAAGSLEEAYDMAVHAKPSTRQKLQESREIAARREQEARDREAAKRAREASSSISGSGSGARVPKTDDGDVSIRKLLEQQFEAA